MQSSQVAIRYLLKKLPAGQQRGMLEIHLRRRVRPWTLTLRKRMQHLLWLGERPGSSASLPQVRAGALRRNLLDEVSHGFLLT
jgi:hypothetical protein